MNSVAVLYFVGIPGNYNFIGRLNKQYRGADNSLARSGKKQANVSVRMA